LVGRLLVEPGKAAKLAERDPADQLGLGSKEEAEPERLKLLSDLFALQDRLWAEAKRSVLLVLQGMDTSGKDGTIRHVMTGCNPQGCRVTPFKKPSAEESSHDYLWRVHHAVPAYGDIGIFNRSHYEDVLVARVHHLVPNGVWSRRYDQINRFEQMLHENNVKILKFFLHISKDEQKQRFAQRIHDKDRQWKISEDDFSERKFWDEYTEAYEDALTTCSTPHAPWFIIPANKKWFRNLAVSHIIVETLEAMRMEFPPPSVDVKKLRL